MRLVKFALVAVAAFAVSVPAEARSKRSKQYYSHSHSYAKRTHAAKLYESPDSYDCIRARGQDPGGVYHGYPCWARAALSPVQPP